MTILALPSWVAHLDLDAFFAAVEQRDDPRLRGRPVAVGTGVAASCSYEARRRGVRTGMSLAEVATQEGKDRKLRFADWGWGFEEKLAIRNPQSAIVVVPPGAERAYL